VSYTKEIQTNPEFWEKVLGNEICNRLLKEKNRDFPQTDIDIPELAIVEELYQKALTDSTTSIYIEDDGVFSDFNALFIKTACLYKKSLEPELIEDVENNLAYNLSKRNKQIFVRILIQDIHRQKEDNNLKGNSSQEEYEDYRRRFLKNHSYVKKLCEDYPEMKRLLFLQIYQLVHLFQDVELALIKDKEHLVRDFCEGRDFSKIQRIESGFSDFHNGGKAVVKIRLDNGHTLIYKPQSLEKELMFQEIYGQFLENVGLNNRKMQILVRRDYGWEEYIERLECHSVQETERYFQRLGVLLFLCYAVNANDVHQENIIASGEYPVFMDLETFPGCRQKKDIQHADQKVREEIAGSVLSTGLLPVLMWGGDGEGVIVNALHRKRQELTPFQLPVICCSGSSKIHIEYRKKKIFAGSSLPVYKGEEVNSADYEASLEKGFTAAYHFMLDNKENLVKTLERFFAYKSRILLRHTQQYSMLLQISLYPEFLERGEKRDLFLHVVDKQRMAVDINEYERHALRQMDVPIFYVQGKDTSLYAGNDVRVPDFYEKSAYQIWKEKTDRLGVEDLEKQLRFMKLSMALLEKEITHDKKTIAEDQFLSLNTRQAVREIGDEICRMAVVHEAAEDVNWSGLRFFEEKSWSIVPLGMYLYDGIGGVAVFLSMLGKYYEVTEYRKVWLLVIKKLFGYTDQVLNGQRKRESNHSGAFVGEGSLISAYLLIYKITEAPVFLEYAKRHAQILEQVIENEESPDLLSGLAGAITVFSWLYQAIKDKRYLEIAACCGEKLWKKAVKQEKGYGIPIFSEERPLAGMAHGNSGYIVAYAYLLELTGDTHYYQRLQWLLDYEDSLFCPDSGNWLDLRSKGREETDINAWCHGAAGILLSRLKLGMLHEFQKDIRVERDIERCLKAFDICKPPQSLCLCHGLAGQYLILKSYLKQNPNEWAEKKTKALLKNMLDYWSGEEGILPQERYNIALMTGIAGIGAGLLADEIL
jgi:type 2 lantibiotic biosynthesis protein LanM